MGVGAIAEMGDESLQDGCRAFAGMGASLCGRHYVNVAGMALSLGQNRRLPPLEADGTSDTHRDSQFTVLGSGRLIF